MSLTVSSRRKWGARKPLDRIKQSPASVRELFIHWPAAIHSTKPIDTVAEECAELRAEQAYHMDVQHWSDIGYNYAAFQSGRVYRLRGLRWVPAAQLGHNTGTVAVTCVLGPDDIPSAALKWSLMRLKDRLDARTGRDLVVRPHSAVTPTSCPGPHLRAILPWLNEH